MLDNNFLILSALNLFKMAIIKKLVCFTAVLLVHYSHAQNFEDISNVATIFTSTSLPTDDDGTFLPRYMASVGNGHVATTIYTDAVFMNGFYNGERGESHRARLPSGNNIRLNVSPQLVLNQTFSLDVQKGVFFERFMYNGASVEQRTFAHRHYTRVIVTQLKITTGSASVTIPITSTRGDPSTPDLDVPETGDFGTQLGATYMCAEIKTREDVKYQDDIPTGCTISTSVPTNVTFPGSSTVMQTFVTAYGFNLGSISSDFNAVANMIVSGDHAVIYDSHVEAWENLWNDAAIEVEGNTKLAKVVYGSLYYILSSLPVFTETNTPNEQFYGLSPGGLAYGTLLSDYQGHSFWDTETWMYPSMLYLYPQAAKEILNYRLAVTRAARDHAIATGFKGARFPWESGVTGREVTPDCCPETRDLQVHISSDISFAIRQYIAMTRDLEWLKTTKPAYVTNPCGLLRDIAEFWTSRSNYNASTGFHDIKGVMPPDEDNHGVDNNGYTNIGAGYAIFYAKYAECLCAGSMDQGVPEEWLDLAKSLKLLYDEEKDYHPEFEGYVYGTSIKQADVVLMGFPQLYDMGASTRKNDLLVYANVTREDGPAMTWAMHTVGFLELDDLAEAAEIFNKSYQLYLREPFKVWTEAKPPTLGAINFITGMGGFLQSIMSGYGGLRLYPEKIVIEKPRVLPGTTHLKLKGLKYLGNVIDADITQRNITLSLRTPAPGFPLRISSNDGNPVDFVTPLTFSTEMGNLHLEITSKTATNCPVPYDKIGERSQKMKEMTKEKTKPVLPETVEDVNVKCSKPGLFALTFDDGPSYNGNTEAILNTLRENNATATFFVTGYGMDYLNLTSDIRKQEILRRIHREGHQIGSHTYSHDSLTENRTADDIINDISILSSTVQDILGINFNVTVLRPPYGSINSTVVNLIHERFGFQVINWNLDTMDWSNKENISDSFQNYVNTLGNASPTKDSFIALHHDPVTRGGELAAMAIDFVRSKGFQLVTVGECIGIS